MPDLHAEEPQAPLYRSEAIIRLEEMGDRTEGERETILKNLGDRLRDWSVVRGAAAAAGEKGRVSPSEIRGGIDVEEIDEEKVSIRLDGAAAEACRAALRSLVDLIVSEGVEAGESERLAYLRAKLEEGWDQLGEAEEKLSDFNREHGSRAAEERIVEEIAREKIVISNCRMDIAAAKARKAALEKKLRTTPESIVTSTVMEYGPDVMKLKAALSAKESKLEKVREKYGEGPKTERLEGQIAELRLKLGVLEEQSAKEETRSPNPVYRDIEEEIAAVKEVLTSREGDISRAEERIEKNNEAMREASGFERERRKLERDRGEAEVRLGALQKKLEDEFVRARGGGVELRVEVLIWPTDPRPLPSMGPRLTREETP